MGGERSLIGGAGRTVAVGEERSLIGEAGRCVLDIMFASHRKPYAMRFIISAHLVAFSGSHHALTRDFVITAWRYGRLGISLAAARGLLGGNR